MKREELVIIEELRGLLKMIKDIIHALDEDTRHSVEELHNRAERNKY